MDTAVDRSARDDRFQPAHTMNRVRVEPPSVEGDTLVGDITATGPVKRFFSGKPFRAEYGTTIEDVPDGILPVPILAHVCPVAWAAGADVVVDTVDATFLRSVRRVRDTLLNLYPEFMSGGAVYCQSPVDGKSPVDHEPTTTDTERATAEGDGSAGMLFTGGVDSTATYVRHREESPTLVSVRGWVIAGDQDERWARMREYVERVADREGVATTYVDSNMLEFLATPLLQAHFQRYLDGAWYSSVGHGLGLLGLCAPLAAANGWDSLYIAATHTENWQRPWGSRPDIDEEVAWNGTRCVHDGYELSRQGKLDRIAEYGEAEGQQVTLRTCSYGDGASNCSDCEKCYRTIVGLLLAGQDPNDYGYEFGPYTLATVRREFERGAIYLSAQTQYHWEVLQDAARERSVEDVPGWVTFVEWLLQQDFGTYVEQSERSIVHRVLQRVARSTPTPVYGALYPLYRRAKRGGV